MALATTTLKLRLGDMNRETEAAFQAIVLASCNGIEKMGWVHKSDPGLAANQFILVPWCKDWPKKWTVEFPDPLSTLGAQYATSRTKAAGKNPAATARTRLAFFAELSYTLCKYTQ